MTKKLMAGIVIPVVLAVGAGSAIAAATSDSAVIRACAAKNGKSMHLANADGTWISSYNNAADGATASLSAFWSNTYIWVGKAGSTNSGGTAGSAPATP